ncbi:hypothetical protein N824_18430 [Pedobacter sp. V48]|nr:hypothetical protein N824_18430 [Pedobacter sp. V48]
MALPENRKMKKYFNFFSFMKFIDAFKVLNVFCWLSEG